MAKAYNVNTQIQFVRSDGTVRFYEKTDATGNIQLEVRVENGLLIVLENGVVVESYHDCRELDNLNAVTLRDMATIINGWIHDGSVPDGVIGGGGVDQSIARFDGVQSIEDSDWFIDDGGVMYPGTDGQDLGKPVDHRVGNIYMDSRVDFASDLNFTNGGVDRVNIATDGTVTFNEEYSFPNTDGVPNQVLVTDGAGVLTFQSPTPSKIEVTGKDLSALVTNSDGDKAVAFTVPTLPENNSYITVEVNGKSEVVGNGIKTKSCYFSGDGGLTARGFSSTHPNGKVQIGDELYWNGSVASYELDAVDQINIYYITV